MLINSNNRGNGSYGSQYELERPALLFMDEASHEERIQQIKDHWKRGSDACTILPW